MIATRSVASAAAKQFIEFVNETGSPYHAVSACAKRLRASGFQELRDGQPWALARGGKYFVTKGGSDIMALVVGGRFDCTKASGMSIVAAHTDSPCLRIRPNSRMAAAGMLQVGVQTYGGGLWHTWLDRPLGFAGKVVVRSHGGGDRELGSYKNDAAGVGVSLEERLVHVPRPVMLIPNLAIHLQSADERKAVAINVETQLQPVLCSKIVNGDNAEESGTESGARSRHHLALLQLLAESADCAVDDVLDADVCLMDAQPSSLVGAHGEFISSPRIDNLLSTWAAVQGLCDFAARPELVAEAQDVCVAVSLDHEEVGSQSSAGADGETLPAWMDRVLLSLEVSLARRPEVYARSFLLSADCAHALHPNYESKHQSEHRPELHKGIVIKSNANQRYATTALTAALVREVCHRSSVPVQEFVVRNDSPCGTTIGPILSARTGVRAIDVGAPQWAMHSCRESCASSDAAHLRSLCEAFYTLFRTVDTATAKL
eukprot:TRINITY_DN57989_c0_g1_i1.p1 TRINITY_DN57989_c0_g1~~TRINITY_DN57989_c0_g1_i1.p1  ORF type:complete len:488 (-),score=69.46 TRINITY_DN57989_c0_g1_i1:26-1489(-)